MIDHVWTVYCARASVDSRTNNVSLFDVIEAVSGDIPEPVQSGIGLAFPGNLVTLWARGDVQLPARGTSRVMWERPGGATEQIAPNTDIDLVNHERLRNIVEIFALPFHGPGRYFFLVEFRDAPDAAWVGKARVPLTLNITGTETPRAKADVSPAARRGKSVAPPAEKPGKTPTRRAVGQKKR